jgi:hypothetical protein
MQTALSENSIQVLVRQIDCMEMQESQTLHVK